VQEILITLIFISALRALVKFLILNYKLSCYMYFMFNNLFGIDNTTFK